KYFPSGDHRGFELSVPGDVTRYGSPPSTGATHTSLWRRFSFSTTVVTVNATSFPSGENAGEDRLTTRYQSAGVNARRTFVSCARPTAGNTRSAAHRASIRRMGSLRCEGGIRVWDSDRIA